MLNVIRDKKPICVTRQECFTQIQGIGNDAMYLRYDDFVDVLKRNVSDKYCDFFAQPIVSDGGDSITWYAPEWIETPIPFSELSDSEKLEYQHVKDDYLEAFSQLNGKASASDQTILDDALRFVSDDFLFCYDKKVVLVAWGMNVDTDIYTPQGCITYSAAKQRASITFYAGEHGTIEGRPSYRIALEVNCAINENDIPQVTPQDNFEFAQWDINPVGVKVKDGLSFTAKYVAVTPPLPCSPEPPSQPEQIQECKCHFDAGENGTIEGEETLLRNAGYQLCSTDIPIVRAKRGYDFKGWNVNPLNYTLDEGKTFVAQYDKKVPWYKRFWLWLCSLFAWKWLKWLLFALLALLLCCLLSRGCTSCSHIGNGIPHNQIGGDGNLPGSEGPVVAPICGEDGKDLPIIETPGAPSVVANRLNIYFEDDNADLNQFAHEFKSAYPDDDYQIIGFDNEVKMVQIQIPENDRDNVRNELPDKIPSQPFIVVDEALFELSNACAGFPKDGTDPGWHHRAIHLKDAWSEAGTKGSSDIVVAVVDDGLDMNHKMFKGRIISPYNVFRQDAKLSTGIGHGTHVAGLSVGSDEKIDKGLSGVAPNCKLMPVQVVDHDKATFSSVTSGIMYAIHHGANVINISIGECFAGLSALTEAQQLDLANNYFKNEEYVWNKIFAVAKKKNVMIVFAAGNDNILACVPPEHRSCDILTVAAVEHSLKATNFTNYGPGANISAPGVDIYSAYPSNKYRFSDGTSMAAPIVSGSVALLKSINPNLESEDIIRVLQSTGVQTDADVVRPLLQLDKAVNAVKNGKIPQSDVYSCKLFPDESACENGASIDNTYINIPDGSSVIANPDGSVTIVDGKTGKAEVITPAPIGGGTVGNGSTGEDGLGNGVSSGRKTGSDESSNNGMGQGQNPLPATGNRGDGFEAIRQRIAQLEKELAELKGQLPENKK